MWSARMWFALMVLLFLTGAAFPSPAQVATPSLHVDEAKMQFHLLPHSRLEFRVVNPSQRPVTGKFTLEILHFDADETIGFLKSGAFIAQPGGTVENVDWPIKELPSDAPTTLGWCRLRYKFMPDPEFNMPPVSGIVQLGPILRDGFGIDLSAATSVAPGSKYPVRIHMENPITHEPLVEALVSVTLSMDAAEDPFAKQRIRTDIRGNATAIFALPQAPGEQGGEVVATIARGPFREESKLEFNFPDEPPPALTVITDKPLYQPGQTVHLRLQAFHSQKRAMAGARLDVAIEDQDGNEQFHEKLATSRFGIAHTDWQIPKKIQLGNCTITAKLDSGDESDSSEQRSEIRISRYELPTFTVRVDPDRSYYLPGSRAAIDIYADYLFGKPVQHGKVKIVRQENRHWDTTTRKWEAEESSPMEGELGGDNHFRATLDLSEDFKSFTETRWQRFEDLTLAAYLTDSSTGRTEQRRFKIRLTAQPIHLYILGADSVPANRPLVFYVLSSYADGLPASTEGKIFAAMPASDKKFDTGLEPTHHKQIGNFHTNRFGIGRVELAPLPANLLRGAVWSPEAYRDDYGLGYDDFATQQPTDRTALLQLQASDAKKLSGQITQDLSVTGSGDFLDLHTDHTLYHPGDSVQVQLVSSAADKEVVVSIRNTGGLLSSQSVTLHNGHASLVLPYEQRFRGDLFITGSIIPFGSGIDTVLTGSAEILFPAPEELRVKVKMPQTTYKPGEEVSADINVLTPEGHTMESALGLLVFDRAVAERVRTDEEFGRDYGYSIFDYFNANYIRSIGGISYRDLLDLDATRAFPDGTDLVAEAMMRTNTGSSMSGESFESGGWSALGAAGTFHDWLLKRLQPAENALESWHNFKSQYPNDEAEVRAALRAKGLDFDELLDPWGQRYRTEFSFKRASRRLELISSGVDKQANTKDDFVVAAFHWPYFTPVGQAIDQASFGYFSQTGNYIRDYPTLRNEMKKHNIDLDSLRDPWGHPYSFTFDISGVNFRVLVDSAGEDGFFASPEKPSWDDVHEWTSRINYFLTQNAALNSALADWFKSTGAFPENEDQLKPVLALAKIDPAQFLDPWGRPYRFVFGSRSRYADRLVVSDVRIYSDADAQARKVTEDVPVTQTISYLNVISGGPDITTNQSFPVAEFSRVVAERTSKDKTEIATKKQIPLSGTTGGIYGQVTDPTGAALPTAELTAISAETGQIFTAHADSAGAYSFANLAIGFYELDGFAPGFRRAAVMRVPVQQGFSTKVDLLLSVGSVSESVEVSAQASMSLDTESSSLAAIAPGPPAPPGKVPDGGSEKPLFTPRLRKYFPETLLWEPEVITDRRGHAHIHFPMADNITAWKMSVLASTEAGQVGIAEKELRSFQPFFLEHDPPKILTVGDQISLPVVLRNYTGQKQSALAEMQPAPWFTILSPARQTVNVPPNGDATSVFTFRADHNDRNAKQKVAARSRTAGDAVERELVVHPDGQEIAFTTSRILAGPQNSLELQIPTNSIPGSIDAELRIYPNLTAHILDAMHGIGKIPAGCAEQITSTAYVSLMALQLLQKADQDKTDLANPRSILAAEARTALQDGYDQLLTLQNPDGGFRYWQSGPTNLALTAYVLRFLGAAANFIEVDGAVRNRARDFLVAHQAKSGAWTSAQWDSPTRKMAERVDPNLTAYVARALADTKPAPKDKDPEKQQQAAMALKSALDFLEARLESWSDPYLAGNYALAALASGRKEHPEAADFFLRRLAHREGPSTYWNLESNNSPFYGWGTGGRMETTGLAVKALATLQANQPDADRADVISRGLQYLLTHKDRYAMWYSTQATQNVLEALIAALPPAAENATSTAATIQINGHVSRTIAMPNPVDVLGPMVIPLDTALRNGQNSIALVRSGNSPALNAALFTSYYVPWTDSEATAKEASKIGERRALQSKVQYDHNDLQAGDRVHCTVQAERIGFSGYGMMLAEIGLRPGAEVDRASLEEARNSGGASGYEIEPDKVVFYVWPVAGGSTFGFDFKLRYRILAMTAASQLYDYYNPESNAAIAPVRFTVR